LLFLRCPRRAALTTPSFPSGYVRVAENRHYETSEFVSSLDINPDPAPIGRDR
jgi:hypothetical protein